MSDKNTINNHNNNGLSGGQIALIIIGGILVIGLVAALIAWLMTDKKKNKSKSKANIVQIGGAVNNEQQPGQTANQTTIQTPITPNNTAETNNQSPTNNDAINQQDKDQLIASVVSEATPQVIEAAEKLTNKKTEQKTSEEQKQEIEKNEIAQEQYDEDGFIQPLSTKEETEQNVKDGIDNDDNQKQDKQKAEHFDEMPDYSGNAPFAGFPLGMMMDGNKGENLQPNMQPIPMIFPAQPNQNVNTSAEQPNLMPQENDLTNQQNQQYFNDQKNGQENNKKLEFPVDFTYKRGDFEKLMQAGRLNNPLEQLPLEKEIGNIDYLKQLDKQEENERKKQQLSNINLPQNVGNLFETANLNENRFNIEEPKENATLAELPTPPQNDISNLSVAQQTNQQANENEETMDDGVVMPLNMMPAQNQDLEQKPMDNNVLSAPPKFVRIKNQNMESIMEDNARPAMVTGGNGSPVSMFNQNANVENSQIDNGMFNKPNFLQEPMPKNDFSNKPAMPNNSMFNQLQPINENEIKLDAPAFMPPMMKMEDKNENKVAPMGNPMPLTQMFTAPMKTNQEAQIDKNNSNQIGNQSAMPTKNQIFDFLMPKQNNNQNEIPNAFNRTKPNILEEQQIQANNNQSQINLGTQNKCMCPMCSGCGGK